MSAPGQSAATGPRHLVLIGLRASGKSTLGRALAQRQGVAFCDLDDATAALMGAPSVRAAWDAQGEPAFRAAETRALAAALGRPGQTIIALGGGTPTAPGAAELLERAVRERVVVIAYLSAPASVLRERLTQTDALANRPSLTGRSALDEIDDVLARRDPLYTRLATRIIPSTGNANEMLAAIDGWRDW